jgi:hypothetical protein
MQRLMMAGAVLFVLPFIASAGTLPDTGQTKCYGDSRFYYDLNPCPQPGEDCYGQDANYAPRNPHSYTDLGNGIVRDNVTGLEWQQDTHGTYTWQQAIDYCENLMYAGYNDWRLPTIKELSTLVDSSIPIPGPTINTDYFLTTQPSFYWSSTNNARTTDRACYVDFNDGSVKCSAPLYFDSNVMAVRGGQSGPFDDLFNLEDNDDGTVTDLETGLMWQQDTAPGTYTWSQALFYCENLTLDGHDDWRLPNRNELQSIIDYSRFTPSIDAVFNAESIYYWTSTTYTPYEHDNVNEVLPYAWVVSFDNGLINCCGHKRSPLVYVRAVRSVQNGSLCLIELIYGEHSAQTKRLRHFRDTILSKTSEGQELIKLYYLWSPVIVKAMEGDEEFKGEVKGMIDSVLSMIEKDDFILINGPERKQ